MDFYSNLENAYPSVRDRANDVELTFDELQNYARVPVNDREVFDHIRDIKDPEHELTLEQLGVVELEKIKVTDKENECFIEFTPTIPHCSMATLIGLSIKVQLIRILPRRFKVEVKIEPGTHSQEVQINKQLADKERVAAALENSHLVKVINDCLLRSEEQELPELVQDLLKDKEDPLGNPKLKYILQCRQPVTTYRRWLEIVTEQEKYNSLINGCQNMNIQCCGGSCHD